MDRTELCSAEFEFCTPDQRRMIRDSSCAMSSLSLDPSRRYSADSAGSRLTPTTWSCGTLLMTKGMSDATPDECQEMSDSDISDDEKTCKCNLLEEFQLCTADQSPTISSRGNGTGLGHEPAGVDRWTCIIVLIPTLVLMATLLACHNLALTFGPFQCLVR